MRTPTTIGTGTRKLGEWAVTHFWPCKECDGTRRILWTNPNGSDPCHYCKSEWLSASTQVIDGIENRFSPDWWQVFGDWLEGEGDPRAADARMVARLLPLDVWPNQHDDSSGFHWFLSVLHEGEPCNIQHLFPLWKYHASNRVTSTGFPTIESAMRALDTAIQERQ